MRLNVKGPTPAQIAAGTDPGLDLVNELLAAATAIIDGYARNAPDAISNESCVRLASWLKRGSGAADSISISGTRLSWRPTPGRNALRSSGAAGLLAPWHRPRATVIEDSA